MTETDKTEKYVPLEFIKELMVTLTELFLQNQPKPQLSSLAVAERSNSHITVKFDGRKYRMWSHMVEVHLKSKNKLGHVSGSRSAPRPEEPEYKQWEMDDNTMKAWLLNSISYELLSNFFFFPTTKEVLDAIKNTFFDESDNTQIYELQMRLRGCTQSGRSLKEYYNTLQRLWREIDLRRPNRNIIDFLSIYLEIYLELFELEILFRGLT
jgi:gag-polypeptide of LTR copia-type/Retrotransposon gag protein